MSGCPNNSARKLYYGLYSTMKAKEIGAVYMRQPKEWTASNHPCLSKAPEGSELGYITSSLYGLETVPRVNYTHTTPSPTSTSCCSSPPTPSPCWCPFLRNPDEPALMDEAIGKMMQPFWKNAHGRALCPVCIAEDVEGELQPVFLTRSQFISHWVQLHVSSFTAICTFSATSLNSRLYQGFVTYILAKHAALSDGLVDKPEGNPLDTPSVLKLCVFGTSTVLSKFLKPKPAPLDPGSSPIGEVPAEFEAPDDPETPEAAPEGESMEVDHVNEFREYLLQDDLVEPPSAPGDAELEGYRKKPDPSDESVAKASISKKKKK